MRILSSLLVLPLMIATLSVTAGARENHCDHDSGKTTGIIGGAVVGGILGNVLGHGRAGNVVIGAAGGALAGGVIGNQADDDRDAEECGPDAEWIQRQRDSRRSAINDQQARDDQREREIEEDREASRRRHAPPPLSYPRPVPRVKYYECQDLGRGYGLVELRTNQILQLWGWDVRGCQYSEASANGF